MDRRSIITEVDSQQVQKFLRIASISIAVYDFVITLHAEWRFYRSQPSILRLSRSCVLFILIRYVSILVLVVSNYGVLSTSFTKETCQRFYIAAPTLKVVQTMISQAILGFRTHDIAWRGRGVGIALVVLYFISISLEWFTNMFNRIPVLNNGSCTPGNAGRTLSAYYYYIITMLYDLIVMTISVVYLLRYNPVSNRLGQIVHSLIYEGIGYFVVLTGVNVFNIVFYHTSNVQTQAQGAAVGYVITWIMSQRLLIHRLGRDTQTSESRIGDVIVFARPAHAARKVVSTLRSKFDLKGPTTTDLTPTVPRDAHADDVELSIHVCVERSTMVGDYTNESEHTSSWRNPSQ